jgi:hypothetical protein
MGDVSGMDSKVAEKPYLNRGMRIVFVATLTISGKAAPSSTYSSLEDDAPHPPRKESAVIIRSFVNSRHGVCGMV